MFILKDIVCKLEEIAPPNLAEEWDNVGIMLGRMDMKVDKVLVCLDVTERVVDEACEKGVQLIISHHPFFFNPVKSLTDSTVVGRLAMRLMENKIAVYSAHTNLDNASNGVNERFAEMLGINNACDCGIGKIGILEKPISFDEYCKFVIERFGLKGVRAHGANKHEVKTVGLCCGSGGGALEDAIKAGADVFVTGEMRYPAMLEAVQSNVAVIEIGHYHSEKIIIPVLTNELEKWSQGLQNNLEVIEFKDDDTIADIIAR